MCIWYHHWAFLCIGVHPCASARIRVPARRLRGSTNARRCPRMPSYAQKRLNIDIIYPSFPYERQKNRTLPKFVLQFPSMTWNAIKCPRMPWNAFECPWMPLNALECYRMPLNALECPWMPLNALECPRMPLNALECLRMPSNASVFFGNLSKIFSKYFKKFPKTAFRGTLAG